MRRTSVVNAVQYRLHAYAKAGGSNATFVFRTSGNRAWPYWGPQLSALNPDLIATLNG